MSFEDRLSEAFEEAVAYTPSPDLFARVTRSIEADRLHRRRVRRVAALTSLGVVGMILFAASMVERNGRGALVLPRWTMELLETLVMVTLIAGLGPAIRRFGSSFIADVFRTDDETGRRFLDLLDIAYYLIFGGVTLLGVDLARLGGTAPIWVLMGETVERLGVLVLVMGILHSVTLAVLPVIGLVLGSVRRRAARDQNPQAPAPSQEALLAERTVRWTLGVLVALILLGMIAVIGPSVLGLVFEI